MSYHIKSLEEIHHEFNTGPSGIDSESHDQRLHQHGRNLLVIKQKRTLLTMLWEQLMDFMILILIAASIISGLMGELTDTFIILSIVALNTILGLIQEWKAEQALEALENMVVSTAKVIRDNKSLEIAAADLIPGDVVLLEAGNIIPADLRFTEVHSLRVDESSLTGESINVEKVTESLQPGEYPIGDRINLGYNGTFVTNGRGTALVVATGMKTELGRIAGMMQAERTRTPLQKRLDGFAKRLTVIILLLCTFFFLFGWLRGEPWTVMLLTAISLAVAAIPEALPALSTIALAQGAKRLVKNNVLIRKLPAVETLGSVTYVCSDKTGTLTINKMTVQKVFETNDSETVQAFGPAKNAFLIAIALNNDVIKNQHNELVGESTEVALAQYAADRQYERLELEQLFPRIAELPFDSKRKCMSTLHETERGVIAIVKGSVDALLEKLTPLQQHLIPQFRHTSDEMASKGYRILGYAIKIFKVRPEKINFNEIESDLTFVGIAGMMDPPRPEAREAVAQCKAAGIIPVMITGDHKLTAQSIAKSLDILSSENDLVIDGPELQGMSEEQFEQVVERIRVYARVDPAQKLQIITMLQKKNQFVAMTGDGVNDAPALRMADIGIAMGITGTEVAKQAAHMILLDDNFATIIKAIKHGRRIFDNILKFIKYIMTGNSGEIWALFLASLAGLPIPLLAIHILWVNLISDGLPGLALASEPAEKNIMRRHPRNPKEGIFSRPMVWHIICFGLLIGIVTVSMQAWSIANQYGHWQTMTFSVLCFSQLGHVMAIRSGQRSFFKTPFFSNKSMVAALVITTIAQLMVIYTPFFNRIFRTQPLSLKEMGIVIGFSSIAFLGVELEKLIRNRRLRED